MPPDSPSNEILKEAISAATRALSQDPELEVGFGGMPATGNKLVLSNPPSKKSDLASYRGEADSLACSKRFSDKNIHPDTGSLKINKLINSMEDIRVEILGSLKYEGVASNLKAKFENKCKSVPVSYTHLTLPTTPYV